MVPDQKCEQSNRSDPRQECSSAACLSTLRILHQSLQSVSLLVSDRMAWQQNLWGSRFNKPKLVGPELQYIQDAIRQGHLSGDGPYTKKCETLLERQLGVARVVLTTSCTHALEMAALLLDIAPGDEVIVPSFTFVLTVNAFKVMGATGYRSSTTPSISDENLVEKLTFANEGYRSGSLRWVGCEMDEIVSIADRHRLPEVE